MTKDALTRNASFAKAHPDELNAALRECEKAQALSPGLAEAYLYMALIFDEREEYDKALKNYRLYMKLYSSGDSKNDFEYARKRVQEIKRQGGK